MFLFFFTVVLASPVIEQSTQILTWKSALLEQVGAAVPTEPTTIDSFYQISNVGTTLSSYPVEEGVALVSVGRGSAARFTFFPNRTRLHNILVSPSPTPTPSTTESTLAATETLPPFTTGPASPPTSSDVPEPGPPPGEMIPEKRDADEPVVARLPVIPVSISSTILPGEEQPFVRQVAVADLSGVGQVSLALTVASLTGPPDERVLLLSSPFASNFTAANVFRPDVSNTAFGMRVAVLDVTNDGIDDVVLSMAGLPGSQTSSGGVAVLSGGPDQRRALTSFPADTRALGAGADLALCYMGGAGMLKPVVVVGASGRGEQADAASGSLHTFDFDGSAHFPLAFSPWRADLWKFGAFLDCGHDAYGTTVLVTTAVSTDDGPEETTLAVYTAPSTRAISGPSALPTFVVKRSDLYHPRSSLLGRSSVIADLNGDDHVDILTTYLVDDETFGLIILGPLNSTTISLTTVRFARADGVAARSIWPLPHVLYENGMPVLLVLNALNEDELRVPQLFAFRLPMVIRNGEIVDAEEAPFEAGTGNATGGPGSVTTVDGLPGSVSSPSTMVEGVLGTATNSTGGSNSSSLVLANVGNGSSTTFMAIVGAAIAVAVVALVVLAALVARVRRRRDAGNRNVAAGTTLQTRRGTAGRSRAGSSAAGPGQGIRRASSRSLHHQRPAVAYELMPRRPAAPRAAAPQANGYAVGNLGAASRTVAPPANGYAVGDLDAAPATYTQTAMSR